MIRNKAVVAAAHGRRRNWLRLARFVRETENKGRARGGGGATEPEVGLP